MKKKKKDLIAKYNQLSTNFYNGDYCNTEHCSLLEAKEQECKALREEKVYNDMACEQFKKQLQSKEQECNQLKAEIDKKELIFAGIETNNRLLIEKNNKLKQTLAEIKDIAEEEVHTRMLFADKESFCDFNKILQKISEVQKC